MVKNLRVIYDGARSAAFNMACDESLFMGLEGGISPPTLRFYRWEFPTVSVGYFQDLEKEIDIAGAAEMGFALIRRPTGGRAVLHWQEVTFCLTIPTGGLGLWDIFRQVHESIGLGLRDLQIPALVLPWGETSQKIDVKNPLKTASCFASPSRYELTLNGKKVAGTAQKMAGKNILIHGSIPIKSTYDSLFRVMVFPEDSSRKEQYEKALEKMTSIFDGTGKEFAFEDLCGAIEGGFRKNWGCVMEKGNFSPLEREGIEKLAGEKYSTSRWQMKGNRA